MDIPVKLPDWTKWLRVAGSDTQPATLSRRHIYILPTRYGWFYGATLIMMLIGAINYTMSLGYVLVFMLTGVGNMAMLHTWRNLARLKVIAGKSQPVFVGDEARFEIVVSDTQNRARYAIASEFSPVDAKRNSHSRASAIDDIAANSEARLSLSLPTTRRGWLHAERIKLHTEFPLGLFHVWAYVALDAKCMVYPQPSPHGMPLPSAPDQDAKGSANATQGDDDFFGHRNYQLGDSLKRVDWKASSREQGILTKQFQGLAQTSLWLDWSRTPGNDHEQRIRQLARWVIDADSIRQPYGLRIPGQEIPPNIGQSHFHQCMQALALL